MDVVKWFLGIHFARRFTPSLVSVHLNQSGFASNLVESFFQDPHNVTPTATPYRSGVPIDSIAPSTDDDDSPAQLRRTAAYQSLIGSIGWLSSSTRPDLSAIVIGHGIGGINFPDIMPRLAKMQDCWSKQ